MEESLEHVCHLFRNPQSKLDMKVGIPNCLVSQPSLALSRLFDLALFLEKKMKCKNILSFQCFHVVLKCFLLGVFCLTFQFGLSWRLLIFNLPVECQIRLI